MATYKNSAGVDEFFFLGYGSGQIEKFKVSDYTSVSNVSLSGVEITGLK